MNGKPITTAQYADLLRYIADYQRVKKCAPSVRDVAAHFGIGSTTAQYRLDRLREQGYLKREPFAVRQLQLTRQGRQLLREVAA